MSGISEMFGFGETRLSGGGGFAPTRKIVLSFEDSTEIKNAFENIERIRNMLTPESMEKVNASVKELIVEETNELSKKRTTLRQTSQERLMKDAIQAFHSLEHIRECISPEEFEELTKRASLIVRKEQIDRAIEIRREKIRSNAKKIKDSVQNMSESFSQHRNELISSQEPERKRLRKNSGEESN